MAQDKQEKKQTPKTEKQARELSGEDLEKVTGGMRFITRPGDKEDERGK